MVEAFEVGEVVIVERKGRPWRQETIEAIKSGLIMTASGHFYDAVTRARINVHEIASKDALVKCTPERLAFLEVRAFLQSAPKLSVANLSLADAVELASLARVFLKKLA